MLVSKSAKYKYTWFRLRSFWPFHCAFELVDPGSDVKLDDARSRRRMQHKTCAKMEVNFDRFKGQLYVRVPRSLLCGALGTRRTGRYVQRTN
jgi:hypothetical protein